ncbi:MAG: carbohydrate ABC transporter permease [Propionibacteriaceae bacterium]|nr:carbohydrate ABC transporter permease [Propionibacteriaceae bacterium]
MLTPIWLVFVSVPLYAVVIGSLRTTEQYMDGGPLSLPTSGYTLANYARVLSGPFPRYLLTTAVITLSVICLILLLALPISYAVVRGQNLSSRTVFRVFLLGLAIPAQAVIIPMFWVINSIGLYDTIWGVVLPTAAFSMPISVLILSSGMRDITNDMYEAMVLDGATTRQIFFRLAVPLSRPAIATVSVFAGMNAWNGFLFPLVLTQSAETKGVTVGLYSFIFQYGADFPALFAAVVLSMTPLLLLYLFARRWLVAGMMGLGGK